jgi:hypothetical protein
MSCEMNKRTAVEKGARSLIKRGPSQPYQPRSQNHASHPCITFTYSRSTKPKMHVLAALGALALPSVALAQGVYGGSSSSATSVKKVKATPAAGSSAVHTIAVGQGGLKFVPGARCLSRKLTSILPNPAIRFDHGSRRRSSRIQLRFQRPLCC